MARSQRRPSPARPLSLAQKRALVALVHTCEPLGSEATLDEVARVSGLRPNAAMLALGGLERRKLAVRFDDRPPVWAPTFSGRTMAPYVRAREPRTRPVLRSPRTDG